MNRRNPTPREFAFAGSAVIALLLLICLSVYNIVFGSQMKWVHILGIVLLTGGIAFFTMFQLLETFIYRKIKLIYKNIHDLKLGKKGFTEKNVNLKNDIISEVNSEVQKWAIEKNSEISRLTELESYRKEFLGNVFHEIKTPVFSVQGYLHTLNDGAIDDDQVNRQYIKKAVRNINRLEQIILDLELIAMQENHKLELDWEHFDITALIKDVFDALELQSDNTDVEFLFKQGCDVPFIVSADQDKIRQVIVNLISNALKYGKEGGSIIVGIYDMDSNILIEITDQGSGIPQDELSRLFERFYRIEKSRVRTGVGGSGLGLAIVKHIVEAHNQTINVRSTVGVGSTFGFTLKKAK